MRQKFAGESLKLKSCVEKLLEKLALKSFSENNQKVETENQKLRQKWKLEMKLVMKLVMKLEMKLVMLRAQVDVKLRAITAVLRNGSFIFLGKYAANSNFVYLSNNY